MLEQPFIEKMRQTHINYLTYNYNDRVTNEFLCKTVHLLVTLLLRL